MYQRSSGRAQCFRLFNQTICFIFNHFAKCTALNLCIGGARIKKINKTEQEMKCYSLTMKWFRLLQNANSK